MDRDDELGGLWLKESQAGKKFMSGRLTLAGETVEVVVFKNTFKQPGERTPDYRVYRSKPRETPQQAAADAAQRSSRTDRVDDLEDTIPF